MMNVEPATVRLQRLRRRSRRVTVTVVDISTPDKRTSDRI
jgi:hypothetical protein